MGLEAPVTMATWLEKRARMRRTLARSRATKYGCRVRHLVIGTAGHVDHGKTTLVHKLTGVMTDRLPEEQRRGITIELGFAPWRISDDVMVSIIDAPGHRKLVHHMIAGATGIDIVLLVVAADEGVMPQTREHIAACRLLGVRRAVVALTKADRVDPELGELAAAEAEELLEEQGIKAEGVLCSGKTGQGIDDVREAVLRAIGETSVADRHRRVRLSVDRVFTVHGAGTVVTGTLVEGKLTTGMPLRILGADHELETSARGLQVHGETRDEASAPLRLAINLGGVSVQEVERGDVITDDTHALPTRVLDVWMQALEPLKRGAEASLFVGTARSTARIQPVDKTDVLSEGGLARLRLTAPLVCLGGDRFVLRGARVDGPAGAVIGGGTILDAHPPRTIRAAKRLDLLTALDADEAEAAMAALARERSPKPITTDDMVSRFSIPSSRLVKAAHALAGKNQLIVATKGTWVWSEAIAELEAMAVRLTSEHHAAAPLEPGLKLQTLRERLAAIAGAKVTAKVVDRLTKEGDKLVLAGDVVRLPTFEGAIAGSAAAEALEKATAFLNEAALNGVSDNQFKEVLGGDPKLSRSISAKLGREGLAIQTGGLWFATDAIAELRSRIVAHFEGEEKLTIAQFKDMTGLGRKQAIPLLEYFDRESVTRRDGSDRFKGSKA